MLGHSLASLSLVLGLVLYVLQVTATSVNVDVSLRGRTFKALISLTPMHLIIEPTNPDGPERLQSIPLQDVSLPTTIASNSFMSRIIWGQRVYSCELSVIIKGSAQIMVLKTASLELARLRDELVEAKKKMREQEEEGQDEDEEGEEGQDEDEDQDQEGQEEEQQKNGNDTSASSDLESEQFESENTYENTNQSKAIKETPKDPHSNHKGIRVEQGEKNVQETATEPSDEEASSESSSIEPAFNDGQVNAQAPSRDIPVPSQQTRKLDTATLSKGITKSNFEQCLLMSNFNREGLAVDELSEHVTGLAGAHALDPEKVVILPRAEGLYIRNVAYMEPDAKELYLGKIYWESHGSLSEEGQRDQEESPITPYAQIEFLLPSSKSISLDAISSRLKKGRYIFQVLHSGQFDSTLERLISTAHDTMKLFGPLAHVHAYMHVEQARSPNDYTSRFNLSLDEKRSSIRVTAEDLRGDPQYLGKLTAQLAAKEAPLVIDSEVAFALEGGPLRQFKHADNDHLSNVDVVFTIGLDLDAAIEARELAIYHKDLINLFKMQYEKVLLAAKRYTYTAASKIYLQPFGNPADKPIFETSIQALILTVKEWSKKCLLPHIVVPLPVAEQRSYEATIRKICHNEGPQLGCIFTPMHHN